MSDQINHLKWEHWWELFRTSKEHPSNDEGTERLPWLTLGLTEDQYKAAVYVDDGIEKFFNNFMKQNKSIGLGSTPSSSQGSQSSQTIAEAPAPLKETTGDETKAVETIECVECREPGIFMFRLDTCKSSSCNRCPQCFYRHHCLQRKNRPINQQHLTVPWSCNYCTHSSRFVHYELVEGKELGPELKKILTFLNEYAYRRIFSVQDRATIEKNEGINPMSDRVPANCLFRSQDNPLVKYRLGDNSTGLDVDRIDTKRMTCDQVINTRNDFPLSPDRIKERITWYKLESAFLMDNLPCPSHSQQILATVKDYKEWNDRLRAAVPEQLPFHRLPTSLRLMFTQYGVETVREHIAQTPGFQLLSDRPPVDWSILSPPVPQFIPEEVFSLGLTSHVPDQGNLKRPLCYQCKAHGIDNTVNREEIGLLKPWPDRPNHECIGTGCKCTKCQQMVHKARPTVFWYKIAFSQTRRIRMLISHQQRTPIYERLTKFRDMVNGFNTFDEDHAKALERDMEFIPYPRQGLDTKMFDYVEYDPVQDPHKRTNRVLLVHSWPQAMVKYLSYEGTIAFLETFAKIFNKRNMCSYPYHSVHKWITELRSAFNEYRTTDQCRRLQRHKGRQEPSDTTWIKVLASVHRNKRGEEEVEVFATQYLFQGMKVNPKPFLTTYAPIPAAFVCGSLDTRIGAIETMAKDPELIKVYEENIANAQWYTVDMQQESFVPVERHTLLPHEIAMVEDKQLSFHYALATVLYDVGMVYTIDGDHLMWSYLDMLKIENVRMKEHKEKVRTHLITLVPKIARFDGFVSMMDRDVAARTWMDNWWDFLHTEQPLNDQNWKVYRDSNIPLRFLGMIKMHYHEKQLRSAKQMLPSPIEKGVPDLTNLIYNLKEKPL